MPSSPFFVETRWGGSEDSPSEARLAEIVAELDIADEEHPDTWLVHEASGWLVRLDEERYAYLENPDLDAVSHMRGITAQQALDLWLRFSRHGLEAVISEPWIPGPRVFSAEEIAAIQERSRLLTLESDRQFYASLGAEDPVRKCKEQGCGRGSVRHSVLCAKHHFEQIRRKPYPFPGAAAGDA
jgi:hypothetical protein